MLLPFDALVVKTRIVVFLMWVDRVRAEVMDYKFVPECGDTWEREVVYKF